MKNDTRRIGAKESTWWAYLILVIFSIISLLPLVWLGMTAFKTRAIAFTLPPVWIFRPSLEAFVDLVTVRHMLPFLLNSFIISVCSTAIAIGLGTFAAFGLARWAQKPGMQDIAFFILVNRMMPPMAVVLPIFILTQMWGLLDTHIMLILLYAAMQLPFVIWMMRGYFEEIPAELEDAAMIDGDSWFQALRKVTLPLAMPAIVATAIFTIILSWNEFVFALILTSTRAKTLPPSIYTFIEMGAINWNEVGAAALLITVPVLIFALLVQKHLVRGLTMGLARGSK